MQEQNPVLGVSFTQLQNKFSLPESHFFRYLQIRNYVRQSILNFPSLPEEGPIFKLLLGSPNSNKLVSGFVNVFPEYLNSKSDFLKNAWEELGLQIGDEAWERSPCRNHHWNRGRMYSLTATVAVFSQVTAHTG